MRYYVLEATPLGNQIGVVIHLDVPAAGLNSAGIPWRTVAAAHKSYTTGLPSVVPSLAPAEQAKLNSGELYEIGPVNVEVNGGGTPGARLAQLEAAIAAMGAAAQTDLVERLRFWGFSGVI